MEIALKQVSQAIKTHTGLSDAEAYLVLGSIGRDGILKIFAARHKSENEQKEVIKSVLGGMKNVSFSVATPDGKSTVDPPPAVETAEVEDDSPAADMAD